MVGTGLRSDTDAGIVAHTESSLEQLIVLASYILTACMGGGQVSNMKPIQASSPDVMEPDISLGSSSIWM